MKFSPYLYTIKQQQNISIMTLAQATTKAQKFTAHIDNDKARWAFTDAAALVLMKGLPEEDVIELVAKMVSLLNR